MLRVDQSKHGQGSNNLLNKEIKNVMIFKTDYQLK